MNKKLNIRNIKSGFEEIEESFSSYQNNINIKYDFPLLDLCCGGIRHGSLTCITARPNTGKTVLSFQLAENIAKQNQKVLFCSCEMGADMMAERYLVKAAGINRYMFFDLYCNRKDQFYHIIEDLELKEKYQYLDNIDIVETTGATIEDILELIEKSKIYKFIVIDYIQRIRGVGSEYEVITNACSKIQTYARQNKCTFIVCSQAKRTQDKQVDIASLSKGSGSIEEDSDISIVLTELQPDDPDNRDVLMTITKNRFGRIKNISKKYRLTPRLNFMELG